MKFWPYEEVLFKATDLSRGQFALECPWLTSEFEVVPNSKNFQALTSHIDKPTLSPDLAELWAGLSTLPIVYHLPRLYPFGTDAHFAKEVLACESPSSCAQSLGIEADAFFEKEWTWDHDAILKMAAIGDCAFYDPITLLSIARRFHYLDCSDNKIDELYQKVASIQDIPTRKQALATLVRQNHYVTEQCQSSLEPAMDLAGSAAQDLASFMNAERGHDKLLGRSLLALNAQSPSWAALDATQALMNILRVSAEKNFLAFCINLDFFEKPQFKEKDGLAELLENSAEFTAAKSLHIHKKINDEGGHESVPLTLLTHMRPVDKVYAHQALCLAELASFAIAQIPYQLESCLF
ncbi:MAG: hypothetical protein V4534_03975 [Myxococcota bacterium]